MMGWICADVTVCFYRESSAVSIGGSLGASLGATHRSKPNRCAQSTQYLNFDLLTFRHSTNHITAS